MGLSIITVGEAFFGGEIEYEQACTIYLIHLCDFCLSTLYALSINIIVSVHYIECMLFTLQERLC